MKLSAEKTSLKKTKADVACIFLFEDRKIGHPLHRKLGHPCHLADPIADHDRDNRVGQDFAAGPFVVQSPLGHLHIGHVAAAESSRVTDQPAQIFF